MGGKSSWLAGGEVVKEEKKQVVGLWLMGMSMLGTIDSGETFG